MGANQKLPETIKHVAPVWSRGAALLAERGFYFDLYNSQYQKLAPQAQLNGKAHPEAAPLN